MTAADNAAGQTNVEAAVRYQACSEVKCLPPVKKAVDTGLAFSSGTASSVFKVPGGYLLVPVAEAAVKTSTLVAAPPASGASAVAQQECCRFC